MKLRYILIGGFILGALWNVFLIQRDQKMFKAYDACTQFTHHPDCPYHNK